MYTIDKEYLKELKKRLVSDYSILGEEMRKDCTDEQRESLMAKQSCIKRTINKVQCIVNDMTLLDLVEELEKNKCE